MLRWMKYPNPAIFFLLGIAVFLFFLNGCAWLRSPDAVEDNVILPRSPAATDTLREACIRSCNHDHDTCNEGPASRAETFDAPRQILGAGAACDKSLRTCLKACR